jgi:hypothetical protein
MNLMIFFGSYLLILKKPENPVFGVFQNQSNPKTMSDTRKKQTPAIYTASR